MPEWAGLEPCVPLDQLPVDVLIEELCDTSTSLIERGYCIVQVDDEMRAQYDDFHRGFGNFMKFASEGHKRQFAQLQFDKNAASPNQCNHIYWFLHI